MKVYFVYEDSQGAEHIGFGVVQEIYEGTFQITHAAPFPDSAPMDSVIHWKPIRAAVQDLIKPNKLITYVLQHK